MAKKTSKDYVEEEVLNEVIQANEESKEDDVQENLEIKKDTKKESLSLEKNKIVQKSTLNYSSRGFKTEKDARDFINTDYFKNLGEADKKEYLAWLENK